MPGDRTKACGAQTSTVQCRRVVQQVVLDEALDEPVAVVVAGMQAQRERLAGGARGGVTASSKSRDRARYVGAKSQFSPAPEGHAGRSNWVETRGKPQLQRHLWSEPWQ